MYCKVVLVGRLKTDPEIIDRSGKIAIFQLTTSRVWKNVKTGKNIKKIVSHQIVAKKNLVRLCKNHLKKNYLVLIEGEIKDHRSEDEKDLKRYTHEIEASAIQWFPNKVEDPVDIEK